MHHGQTRCVRRRGGREREKEGVLVTQRRGDAGGGQRLTVN